ncbi:hypothetical protein [uncultured Kordia sp.]|uniref:hypothetical protein n=1 Tax=uncultured Kordia sp. TaxID=507699 RepID=UPI0026270B5B|nr:hypothetical protein [uncultured Kordia sp.]
MRQIKNILTILISIVLLVSCITDTKKEITKQKAVDDSLFSLNLDSIKHHYGKKFTELRTIINRHDPINLLATGVPSDEYEPEVKTIIVQLEKEMTKEQIHDLIYQEFLRWFENDSVIGKKDSYKKLASAIDRWNKTGFYINEKGEAHIDSIYIDENEVGKYKEYVQKKKGFQKTFKAYYPKYPKIGKAYKFLGRKDSINYAVIIQRLDSSRIEFLTDNTKHNNKAHKGIAVISKQKKGYYLNEKSMLNNNSYKAAEFIEQKDSSMLIIRVGIDSIGSGDRLLLRLLKKHKNKIITDVKFAN